VGVCLRVQSRTPSHGGEPMTPVAFAIRHDLVPCTRCRADRGDPCRTPGNKCRSPHADRCLATLRARRQAEVDQFSVSVNAPTGSVFAASGCHHLDAYFGVGEPHASPERAAEWLLIETYETEPCADDDCEICDEEPDER
jgi:hypothetical protein